MILDVANTKQIENPSAEQVEHYLQRLSSESPFLILDASADCFMQVTLSGIAVAAYRVEYREGDRMHYATVTREQAARLIEAFRRAPYPARTPSPGSPCNCAAAFPRPPPRPCSSSSSSRSSPWPSGQPSADAGRLALAIWAALR